MLEVVAEAAAAAADAAAANLSASAASTLDWIAFVWLAVTPEPLKKLVLFDISDPNLQNERLGA